MGVGERVVVGDGMVAGERGGRVSRFEAVFFKEKGTQFLYWEIFRFYYFGIFQNMILLLISGNQRRSGKVLGSFQDVSENKVSVMFFGKNVAKIHYRIFSPDF